MDPVKFEILALDKSKPGTDSAAKNVDDLTAKINQQKAVIEGLQAEITKLQAAGSKGAGVRTDEDQAMINALEKQVKELQASLVDLQNQKEKVSTTPVISPKLDSDVLSARKSFNGLNMSIQQVARELPNLAMGPQLFFLAISNNLPILSDQIKLAKEEYNALLATGVKGTPVWRQVLSSLFSTQTAFTALITLMIVFAPKLVDLFKKWSEGSNIINQSVKNLEALNFAVKESEKNLNSAYSQYGKQYVIITKLSDEWKKLGNNLAEKKKFIEQNKTSFNQLGVEIKSVKDAENLLVDNTDNFVRAMQIRARSMAAQSTLQELYSKRQKLLDEEEGARLFAASRRNKIYDEDRKKAEDALRSGLSTTGVSSDDIIARSAKIKREAIAKSQQEASDILLKEADSKSKQAEIISKQIDRISLGMIRDISSYRDVLADSGIVEGTNKSTNKGVKDITNYYDTISDAEAKAIKKVEEMRLSLMRDGYDKRKEEARVQLEAELSRISTEERERLQAVERARKKGISISPEQVNTITSAANLQRSLAQDIYTSSLSKIYDQSVDEMVGKYQSYTDRKLAIERKFNEDIRKLIELRAEAQAKGDQIAIERLTRAINQAKVDKVKELMKNSFDQFKESPEYIRAFEDLRNTSSDTLNFLIKEFQKFKNEAAKSMDPKDLREYITTMRELMDEIETRDPFTAIINNRKKLSEAEGKLNRAQSALDTIRSGGQAVDGYSLSNGKISIRYKSEAKAIKDVNEAKDEYNEINNRIYTSEGKILNLLDDVEKTARDLGGTFGSVSGDIIGFISDISEFSIQLSSVANKAGNAISAMEKASVILTVISATMQIAREIQNLLPSDEQKFENYDAKIEEINKLVDSVNEYELAVLKAAQAEKGWFGQDSISSLKSLRDQQQQIIKNYYDKLNEMQATYENKSGGGWLTEPWRKFYNATYGNIYGDIGGYKESLTRAQENLRIETRKASKGFLGTGIGGKSQKTEDLTSWIQQNLGLQLFDTTGMIDENVAKIVLDKYGNKLVGQTKQTLEELVGMKEQYNEYISQLREYVASAYEPLVGNMTDALFEWLKTGKSAFDSLKEYASGTFEDIAKDMIRTLVMDKVFGNFKDDISKMYDEYFSGKTNEGELSTSISDRMKQLFDKFKEQLPGLETILKTISDSFKNAGIDINGNTSVSQKAQSGGISTISEDTGTRIEGALTGLTNRVISIDDRLDKIRMQWDSASKILADIAENTLMAANILEKINTTLNVINRDGVQVK